MRAPLFALAVVLAAGPAAAAVQVIGNDIAVDCSRAAYAGRSDRNSIVTCTRALEEENLSRRDRAGTLVNRGILFTRGRAYENARRDLDQALALQPDLGEAWVNSGVIRMADRDYALALDEINRGLELGVDEPAKAYYNRALVNESLDDALSAYQDYVRARDLAPEWDAPRKQLARFRVAKP